MQPTPRAPVELLPAGSGRPDIGAGLAENFPGGIAGPILPVPLDPNGTGARRLLDTVQGGILSEAGRGDFGALMFFAFSDRIAHLANARAVREGATLVTSALQQHRQACRPSAGAEPFFSVGFTGRGLRACGLRPASAAAETANDYYPPDGLGCFDDGQVAEAVRVLHDEGDLDGSPTTWEAAYLGELDGLWLIGAISAGLLERAIDRVSAWCSEHGWWIVQIERGATRRDEGGTVREAFGFADGIAVPRFLQGETGRAAPAPGPLSEVLLGGGVHAGGSFLVFRKLEQNVRAFRAAHDPRAAEQVVGRSRDGVPLHAVAGAGEDFDFRSDPHGKACPFHAHIRRANPRGATEAARGALPRRLTLIRRGWVYGDDSALTEANGADGGVGLLFLAYARSLEPFRVMQGDWLFRRGFPVPQASCRDGLLFGEFTDATGRRRRWVEPRGGAYFYVPSLPWLRTLRAPGATSFRR